MASSRSHGQLNLPPTPVNKVENGDGVLKKSESGPADLKKVENGRLTEAFAAAGALIDQAREAAHIPRKVACGLMFISEAQYSRWVSGAANDTPSFARLLLMPPEFWAELIPMLSARQGVRQMFVARLLGAAADVAVAVGR